MRKFLKILYWIRKIGVEELLKRIEEYHHDSLTGLCNRRALTEDQEREVAVVFLDLDNFKEINDNLGYEEGDRILKKFSEILQFYSREEDLFMRWGGDEFVMILPKTIVRNAERLVKRIQKKIKEESLEISFSWGIVANKEEKNLLLLIEEAGNLMRNEKQARKRGYQR